MVDNINDNECPIFRKFSLTVEEVNAFTGIGLKTIYRLVAENKDDLDGFVLKVGKKTLIKREKFEEFLNSTNII